ncbi:MAG: efflux RND transporter periplasmic adaptor subunit [Planctomycetes bacterium]|nr:efflux RND transporter periplasmic adaptor subunit [Planctomycetota bacterium]
MKNINTPPFPNPDRISAPRVDLLKRNGATALILALTLLASCDGQNKDAHSAVPRVDAAEKASHSENDGHAHGTSNQPEHADEVTLTSDAVARYGIKTQAAQLWVLRPTITAPARVGFNTEAMAHVGSPLRGRIAEVKVRVGDPVKVGQELAVIESPELGEAQADYLQRRVAVDTAGPAVDLSKVAWERAQGLLEKSQGISLTEVQRREAEHKVSIAALKAAESARTAAANRLHLLGMNHEAIEALASTGEVVPRYAIRAAIDGIVVQREVTLGELVGPDREYLMVLADATKLWVLADVPEAKLLRIHPGAKAWIGVGALGESGSKRFEGSVAFISPFVDPTTRTAQVRIEVPVAELGLRPGMFAQAEIVEMDRGEPSPAPVLAVPEDAIQTVEGGPALFVPVQGEANTYAKRAVTIGRAVGGLVPVFSGLVEGEVFVSEGTFILKADLGKGAAAHDH